MRDCINLDWSGGADFDMGWLAVADMQERRLCIDVPGQRTALPSSLGFLEMFEVGNVGRLDVAARWAKADTSRTLQAPVGVDAQGETTMLRPATRRSTDHIGSSRAPPARARASSSSPTC